MTPTARAELDLLAALDWWRSERVPAMRRMAARNVLRCVAETRAAREVSYAQLRAAVARSAEKQAAELMKIAAE